MSVLTFEPAHGKVKGTWNRKCPIIQSGLTGAGRLAFPPSRRRSSHFIVSCSSTHKKPRSTRFTFKVVQFLHFIYFLGGINIRSGSYVTPSASTLKFDSSLYFWGFLDRSVKLLDLANYFHLLLKEQWLSCLFWGVLQKGTVPAALSPAGQTQGSVTQIEKSLISQRAWTSVKTAQSCY